MGQRITVHYFDDIAPDEPASVTARFAHDGARYEIDLTSERARELADVLAPFIGAARKVGAAPANGAVGDSEAPRAARAPARPGKRSGGRPGALRDAQRVRREWRARVHDWAAQTGYPDPGHPTNGRMPEGLVSAYVAANPDDPEPPALKTSADLAALGV